VVKILLKALEMNRKELDWEDPGNVKRLVEGMYTK
jgi:hypothetical protein